MIGSGLTILTRIRFYCWGRYCAPISTFTGSYNLHHHPRSAPADPAGASTRISAALAPVVRARWLRAARLHGREPDQPAFPARPAGAAEGSRAAPSCGTMCARISPSASTIPANPAAYNVLQKLSYTSRRSSCLHPADDPDRLDIVAGDGRGVAVAARPVRRAAIGAIDPFHPTAGSLWFIVRPHWCWWPRRGP